MSDDILHISDPNAAYAAAYLMGCDLRQKFGSQNLDALKRDHVDRPYQGNAYYEQIVRGFTRGYQHAEAPAESKYAAAHPFN
jgi:hypothetical protein